MNQREEWNRQVVEEFRGNGGVVGGDFAGVPLLLLHHVGARSGTARVSPVAYRSDGERWVIFASNGGRPTHPGWFHNLEAHPAATIEVGTDTVAVVARVAAGDEHDRLWSLQKKEVAGFADYETNAQGRTIPVVVLEPVG
ncbi:MAG TPA: nitroreductase family deazaflavin-dependent oxidoreductase [Acidimicrobiales bacterium]|nr:nitroreductase family deazaflavin-dependent oxidoreductase [Acidimicrobiales bacterium]